MSEHKLQNDIRIYLSQLGYIVFRINVIGLYTKDGRYIPPSVPKGHSDLVAYKQGKTYFIEVKYGKNKPSDAQLNFISVMQRQGFVAGTVWSVSDVNKLLGGE